MAVILKMFNSLGCIIMDNVKPFEPDFMKIGWKLTNL